MRLLEINVVTTTNTTSYVWIPNIGGQLRIYPGSIYQNTGVFLGSKGVNKMCAMSNGSNQGQIDILFDANDGNNLYSGDKFQSPALQTLCCIKL